MAKIAREMVLNRNLVLASLYGHAVRFEKDKPVFVPPIMHAECMAIGAVFADGKAAVVEEAALPSEILDPIERAEALLKIVTSIVERNSVDDFTAGGIPKSAVVSKTFGFEVTTREVRQVMQAYWDAAAAAKEA